MKKIFIYFLIMGCSALCYSQSLSTAGSNITIDVSNAPYPVVGPSSNAEGSSASSGQKAIMLWFEAGNGFFSSAPGSSYTVNGNWNHPPLLLSTKLYDTTKDRVAQPPTELKSATKYTGAAGSPAIPLILNGQSLKITANCRDIVPGDPMAFAITYRIPDTDPTDPSGKKTTNNLYKLYFFYNNNTTFSPLSNTNKTISVNGNTLDACRIHSTETVEYGTPLSNNNINPNGSVNWVQFNIPKTQLSEKSVFVSLTPNSDLEIGKSGSIYAVLTNPQGGIVAVDSIPNMRFAPAHDPNYLVMRPFCLKFPKKVYPFNFTVHFQNTGEGNAKEVKVIIQLPKGMDIDNLRLNMANFAGKDYTSLVQLQKLKVSNQVIAIFKKDAAGLSNPLLGTALSSQPATDPRTMGEIQFTVNSTVNTDDVMEAHADIFFLSEHPSNDTTPDGYEQPVTTNTAITKYQNCDCDVRDCPIPGCKKILGLCWWWWILIITGFLLILWLILRKRKKEEAKNTY